MSTPGTDRDHGYPVLASEEIYRGAVITLRRDTLQMSDGSSVEREIVAHPGAVGVLALDDEDRVVMVNQFRPALRDRFDELPAGLLDVDGEPALEAARRELAEEALLRADDWAVLVDVLPSPGFSQEAIRIFLARGLHEAPRPDGFVVEHEEITMDVLRVPLDEAVTRVLDGRIGNAAAIAGILAASVGRQRGWDLLRPADAPWPARPGR